MNIVYIIISSFGWKSTFRWAQFGAEHSLKPNRFIWSVIKFWTGIKYRNGLNNQIVPKCANNNNYTAANTRKKVYFYYIAPIFISITTISFHFVWFQHSSDCKYQRNSLVSCKLVWCVFDKSEWIQKIEVPISWLFVFIWRKTIDFRISRT